MLFKSGGKGKTLCDILQILTAFESKKLISSFVLAATVQIFIHFSGCFYFFCVVPDRSNGFVYLCRLHFGRIKSDRQYFAVYVPVCNADTIYFGSCLDPFFAHAAVAQYFKLGGHGGRPGSGVGLAVGYAEVGEEDNRAKQYGFHVEDFKDEC